MCLIHPFYNFLREVSNPIHLLLLLFQTVVKKCQLCSGQIDNLFAKYASLIYLRNFNYIYLSLSLNPSVSKQHSVVPSQIFELEDGTSSYKDFAMSKNNRFTSAGQASKNIIQPPSCVLHYYNVPLCVTEETFVKVGS